MNTYLSMLTHDQDTHAHRRRRRIVVTSPTRPIRTVMVEGPDDAGQLLTVGLLED